MKNAIDTVFNSIFYQNTSAGEFLGGLIAMHYGAWMANPWWGGKIFAIYPAFEILNNIPPAALWPGVPRDVIWGIAFMVAGTLIWVGMARRSRPLINHGLIMLAFLWSVFAAALTMYDFRLTSTCIYPYLALGTMITYWRGIDG